MFARQPDLTYEEYLISEQASPTKHEFMNGQALRSIDLAIALSDIYEDVRL